jgi:deoxyribodipyrimidine photo-lyase
MDPETLTNLESTPEKKSLENGLFIFRRDFRITDNNGLNQLVSMCKNVYTIFIFTPEQVGAGNAYKSNNAVQFMIESLEDLSAAISQKGGRLYTFYGHNESVVSNCIKYYHIDVVGFNKDYTPYALKRDQGITDMCKKRGVECIQVGDYYLHEPGTIFNGSGAAYQKFTPYYNTSMKHHVEKPAPLKKQMKFAKKSGSVPGNHLISLNDAFFKFTKTNENILMGGRKEAIWALKSALRTQNHYASTRNDLDKPTSKLSAYIKFGCLSIREVYWAFKSKHFHDLNRQVVWRDFYMNILYSYPHVLGHPMKPSYSKIKWHNNSRWLDAWKNGMTGFPVVDAAMRELNTTGFMHNRARLIVASFLVKTLLINWREGEKYFATKLTDYDVASNNGNWQWVAGTGADSQQYNRIFNPWTQSEEHDPHCIYIKKWIPELKDIPIKDIHNWNISNIKLNNYPKPILDYAKQKKYVLNKYKVIYK